MIDPLAVIVGDDREIVRVAFPLTVIGSHALKPPRFAESPVYAATQLYGPGVLNVSDIEPGMIPFVTVMLETKLPTPEHEYPEKNS